MATTRITCCNSWADKIVQSDWPSVCLSSQVDAIFMSTDCSIQVAMKPDTEWSLRRCIFSSVSKIKAGFKKYSPALKFVERKTS